MFIGITPFAASLNSFWAFRDPNWQWLFVESCKLDLSPHWSVFFLLRNNNTRGLLFSGSFEGSLFPLMAYPSYWYNNYFNSCSSVSNGILLYGSHSLPKNVNLGSKKLWTYSISYFCGSNEGLTISTLSHSTSIVSLLLILPHNTINQLKHQLFMMYRKIQYEEWGLMSNTVFGFTSCCICHSIPPLTRTVFSVHHS